MSKKIKEKKNGIYIFLTINYILLVISLILAMVFNKNKEYDGIEGILLAIPIFLFYISILVIIFASIESLFKNKKNIKSAIIFLIFLILSSLFVKLFENYNNSYFFKIWPIIIILFVAYNFYTFLPYFVNKRKEWENRISKITSFLTISIFGIFSYLSYFMFGEMFVLNNIIGHNYAGGCMPFPVFAEAYPIFKYLYFLIPLISIGLYLYLLKKIWKSVKIEKEKYNIENQKISIEGKYNISKKINYFNFLGRYLVVLIFIAIVIFPVFQLKALDVSNIYIYIWVFLEIIFGIYLYGKIKIWKDVEVFILDVKKDINVDENSFNEKKQGRDYRGWIIIGLILLMVFVTIFLNYYG